MEGFIDLAEQQQQSYDSVGNLIMVNRKETELKRQTLSSNNNACRKIIHNQIAGLVSMIRKR